MNAMSKETVRLGSSAFASVVSFASFGASAFAAGASGVRAS